ncbi:SIR2 family protein [Fluviicola sp.]|uniref:SIR2 family protein n=1 Tax=Fluviicola sp. TaxID=1917219 RepID=UPI0031D4F49F
MSEDALNDLKTAYKSGSLNLYLGAGVSAASGLPNWKQLVVSMYFRFMNIEHWHSIKPFPNYLYAMGEWYLNKTGESLDIIIRKLKTHLSDEEFLKILYECLYNQFDEVAVRNPFDNALANDLLNEITALAAQPDRKLNSVITYNFDDLLEQSFQSKQIDYTSVFDLGTLPQNGSVPIYHPHGFMPFENPSPTVQSTGNIILSEDDYNSIASNSHYWANLIQTSMLTQGTGLMIGLSFSDRNLRRLIDLIANIPLNTNNYIFLKKNSMPEFTEEDSRQIKQKAEAILDKMRRAAVKVDSAVYENCQTILTELFRMDEQITQRVFDEMRLQPIWFTEYPEITEFVRKIQE